MEKPEYLKEKYLLFLDSLRNSGVTNMFGAGSYLQDSFPELNKKEAGKVLLYWMKTFDERHN